MNDDQRSLRLQETIYPFGPGAIVDILGESFIAPDIAEWPKHGPQPLRCVRLERELGVAGFKTAPVESSEYGKSGIPLNYWRFPRWRFCQACSKLSNSMNWVQGVAKNTCASCDNNMVPMRFVAVCENGGHLQEINWPAWTHRRGNEEVQNQCQDKDYLFFRTATGRGESLSQTYVSCRSCGAERGLGALTGEKSLANDGFRCRGQQPWEYTAEPRTCPAELRAVQRGSTSLHIPEIISAIDIPEETSKAELEMDAAREHPLFSMLENTTAGELQEQIVRNIHEATGASIPNILRVAGSGAAPTSDETMSNLLTGEWAAFTNALEHGETEVYADFDVRPAKFASHPEVTPSLSKLVTHVGKARRLREVRAMRGFRRYKQDKTIMRVDLHRIPALDWYPAVEQFGEGIFVSFNEDMVRSWESNTRVIDRVATIASRVERSSAMSVGSHLSPRYLMLHTLAHQLIRRLEYSSGYSAASLRERIYALPSDVDPQAGVLIYAASGDAQGTLGGLVRLAEEDSFGRLLLKSIENVDMCSNDPVCRESKGQGPYALNMAACHGCSLIAETSCERRNMLLDRNLLLGDEDCPGFFDEVIIEVRAMIDAK